MGKSPSIRTRLVAGFVITFLFLIAGGAANMWAQSRLDRATAQLEQANRRTEAALRVGITSAELVALLGEAAYFLDINSFVNEIEQVRVELADTIQVLRETTADLPNTDPIWLEAQRVQTRADNRLDALAELIVTSTQEGNWQSVYFYQTRPLIDYHQLVTRSVEQIITLTEERQAVAVSEAAAVRRLVKLIPVVVSLLVLAAVAVTAAVTIRSITAPVARLTEGATRLAAGHLQDRVTVESQDELGRLAIAFNEMADQLQTSYAELERRVEERTRALGDANRHLTLLNEIIHLATSTMDVHHLLQTVVDRMASVINSDACYITLWDEDRETPIPAVAYGPFRDSYSNIEVHPDEPTLTEAVVRAGTPLVVGDNTPLLSPRIAEMLPARSTLILPLSVSERKLGAAIISFNSPHTFTEEEITRSTQAAEGLAVALDKTLLFHQAQQEQQRLEALLHSTGDAVFMLDADLRFLLVNPAAEQLLGVSPEHVRGMPAIGISPVTDAAIEALERQPKPVGETPIHFDIRTSGRDLRGSMAPVREPTGTTRGWVLTIKDVTDLMELGRLRARMLDVASHDLKNPLHLAQNYLALLLDELGPRTPEQEEMAQQITHSLSRMGGLITGILDLALIARSSAPSSWGKIDWPQVVSEILAEMQSQLEAQGHRVIVDIPRDLPTTAGDRIQLRQALYNLVDNAIKYTPGKGQITIQARSDGETLDIAVKDTGPGISPDLLPRLFKPLPRGEEKNGSNRRSGLGLTLVREMVESHNGRVSVETSEEGSIFTISLPIITDYGKTSPPRGDVV